MKKIVSPYLFAGCFLLFSPICRAQSSPAQQGAVTAQDVCNSVLAFLNEMGQNNFKNFLSTLISSETVMGMQVRKYNSGTPFPQAKKIVISDTNSLQQFRDAEILMLEESTSSNAISEQMKIYYNQANAILKLCLEAQKFTTNNPADDMLKRHKMSADYRFQIPSRSPFGNMQSGNTMVVETYIDQKAEGSGFKTLFYIRFKRV